MPRGRADISTVRTGWEWHMVSLAHSISTLTSHTNGLCRRHVAIHGHRHRLRHPRRGRLGPLDEADHPTRHLPRPTPAHQADQPLQGGRQLRLCHLQFRQRSQRVRHPEVAGGAPEDQDSQLRGAATAGRGQQGRSCVPRPGGPVLCHVHIGLDRHA